MIRKANDIPAVLVVSAAILFAVGTSAHARFVSVGLSHPKMGHATGLETAPVHGSNQMASHRYGWGYGRGW